ncbi:MAG: phosphomannomutase/phosphoglucomutase [Candidatus Sungbacteria bacterium]|nr:phosphomannomutase/phosphoglucomutase [Candidatus Sungbacteria bacterium]
MPTQPHIFKAYDIRGKYPAELDEAGARGIGNAIAAHLLRVQKKKKLTLLVCRDIRTSSESLARAAVQGITESGCDVLDAGIATTPFFYFLLHTVKCDGGVVITASHNPAEYNGMKICGKNGAAVSEGNGMEEIRDMVFAKKYVQAKTPGTIEILGDFRREYAVFVTKKSKVLPTRAVIDACGGATTYILPEVLGRLSAFEYKPIFFEPDGTFRRHSPNPLDTASQKHIVRELRAGNYRFGTIFDGDGDRILFFDEKGGVISSEFIGALFMDQFLAKEPGAAIVMPPNTSRGVREYITEHGGKIKLSRVGYAFIQPAMRKLNAVFGAELSGHFHFRDFFFKDSGVYALVKFSEFLSGTNRPLSELIAPMKRYVSSGEVNFSVRNKDKVLAAVEAHFQEFKNAVISKIDGISVDFPEWWFNMRGSNTEPLVRLVLEAKTEKLFQEKFEEVKKFLW